MNSTNSTTNFHTIIFVVFRKTPYDWQTAVGTEILSAVEKKQRIHTLCVRPTGGGKTLLFTTTAASLKGITLCIMPLLSLGADQVKKLIANTTGNKSIITGFHLDDIPSNHLDELINLMKNYNPLKTVIIFASPQSLLKERSPVLPYLISDECKLSMVVIDEIHLVTHFGLSFRKEFCDLKDVLLRKIRGKKVPLLFLTATCTNCMKVSLKAMFSIKINHVHWLIA